jgi:hypothetical protein
MNGMIFNKHENSKARYCSVNNPRNPRLTFNCSLDVEAKRKSASGAADMSYFFIAYGHIIGIYGLFGGVFGRYLHNMGI